MSVTCLFLLNKQQKTLMNAWDRKYSVSEWECSRAKGITNIQNSENLVIKSRRENINLW